MNSYADFSLLRALVYTRYHYVDRESPVRASRGSGQFTFHFAARVFGQARDSAIPSALFGGPGDVCPYLKMRESAKPPNVPYGAFAHLG